MDAERYSRIERIFQQVVEVEPDHREALLDESCGDDLQLRSYVNRLLAHDTAETSIIDQASSSLNTRMPRRSFADTSEQPGTMIDRYRILEHVGEGGFGAVYRAEQTSPVTRTIALKIIKLGMDTKQVIARFEAERQALAMMDHPNIARVLDAGATSTGRPFFVMEFVEGAPITEFCDRAQMTTRERLELFHDVCLAVQHAHQKGIIHRDLKPSNVLVSLQDGRPVPKIIDFGIAKAISERLTQKTLVTSDRHLVGTPEYMSPEQAELGHHDIDTRSDIYSLGIILYELLTGSTPLESSQLRSAAMSEMQRMICEEEPERPSTRTLKTRSSRHPTDENDASLVPDVARTRKTDAATLARQLRGDLDWIVMKSLEKDRSRRYATAAALAEDIQRHLNHEPVEASPPSTSYRLRKFIRRNQTAMTTLGGIAAALVLGLAATSYGLVSAQRERDEKELARQLSETVTQFLEDMLASVDPTMLGRDVTVRKVLDEASRTIAESFRDNPLVEARLRQTIGATYISLGFYAEAEPHIATAVTLFEEQLGDDDPLSLESRHSLAVLSNQLGRINQAEPLFFDVVERRRAVLGPDHPDTLKSQSDLALLYSNAGRPEDAEPLFQQTLETSRRALGNEHPVTLKTIDSLAAHEYGRGRFDTAESLYVEALELRRETLGTAHPDTLGSMNNLALLYQSQGHYEDAEQLFEETVNVSNQVLGPEHWQTLISMDNLALLYRRMARYDDAEGLQTKVVEIERRVLGDDHPTTLHSMHHLGSLFGDQGRADECEHMLKNVLDARQRVLGPDHPETLSTMHNLAANYRRTESFDIALPLLEELYEKRRKLLAEDHPSTLATMHNLASVYRETGRLDDAEPLHLHLRKLIRKKLGEEHPNTLATMSSLAVLYRAQERYDESDELQTTALEGLQRVLGEAHPSTVKSMHELALVKLTREPPASRELETALSLAAAVCELSNRQKPHYLETLALAHYLTGDSSIAIEILDEADAILPEGPSHQRDAIAARRVEFRSLPHD